MYSMVWSRLLGLLLIWLLRHSSEDKDWMNTASQTNLAQIAAGRLAAEKAFRPDVRAFADSVVASHDSAELELIDLARQEKIVLADSPDTRDHEKIQALSRLTGAAFDTGFIRLEMRNGEKAIELFQQESGAGRDLQAQGYATKYLPMLRRHLATAKDFGIVIPPEVRVISERGGLPGDGGGPTAEPGEVATGTRLTYSGR